MNSKITERSAYRWFLLTMFLILAGISQFLWLNYAPLLTEVQNKFQITESTAGLLLLVFPLIYVIFSVPSGLLIDRKGYRYGIGLGSILMTLGAGLRIYPGPFYLLLTAQIFIAIGQPYVVNGISKLVMDWYAKEHSAIATGLGTMGIFIGMGAGLAWTKPCVDAFGYEMAMIIFAGITFFATALFLVFAKDNPAASHIEHPELTLQESFAPLLKQRSFIKLFVISFLGLGFFNGLTTWIEPILAPNGMDAAQAGNVGGMLIVGGILGAIVIPTISDTMKKRKPFVVGSFLAALLTVYPLCMVHNYSEVLLLAALQGFFFLPALALLLEVASELSGERLAGASTGLLMLSVNVGAVIVIVAMEWIKGDSLTFYRAVLLMAAVLLAAFLTSLTLPETGGSKK